MTGTLILIPTALECEVLAPLLEPHLTANDHVELCGFGLVAAAARTSQLIEQQRPDRLILSGIAGTYADRLPVGSAALFDQVACFGIGAGSGAEHQTLGDMGWYHVGGRQTDVGLAEGVVADVIRTGGTALLSDESDIVDVCQLLSVAAAADGEDDVAVRRARFPDADAEDMESFGVALACQLAQVPLLIVRGISNRAGDRELSGWQVRPALKAAAGLIGRLF